MIKNVRLLFTGATSCCKINGPGARLTFLEPNNFPS